MKNEIRFEPETHRYFRGEQELLSVTTVLALGGLDGSVNVPKYILEPAADKGTKVHLACCYHDDGDLDLETLDPVLVPYVHGWMKFKEEHKPEIIVSEWICAGKDYAGTIDRVVRFNGLQTVLDIKSGGIYPAVRVQLAAYAMALGKVPLHRLAVKLTKEGGYELHTYSKDELDADYEAFQAAMKIAQWKRRHANGNGTGSHSR